MDIIRNINNSTFVWGQNTGSDDIFVPPSREECRKTLKKIKREKYPKDVLPPPERKEAEDAARKLKDLRMEITTKVARLNNGVVLLVDARPENVARIINQTSLRKAIVNNKAVLDYYAFNGKKYLAVIPKKIWEKADYRKNMDIYYASGQYHKDIVSVAHKVNVIDTAYNALCSPIDKAFNERASKIQNKYMRRSVSLMYGLFRTSVLIQILSKCPHVASIAGGLYMASFSAQIIFDFRGLVDFFKNSSDVELYTALGSLLAIGVNFKTIRGAMQSKNGGKKIVLSQDGTVKEYKLGSKTAEHVAAKDTGGRIGQKADVPAEKPPAQKSQTGQSTERTETKINLKEFTREKAVKKYDQASTPADKIKVAEEVSNGTYPNISVNLYVRIAEELLKTRPRNYHMRLTKIYNNMDKMCRKGKISNREKLEFMNLLKANNHKVNSKGRVVKIK
ncbi:MAG: hypothetical protein ABIH00_01470 [Armatimonadota bacterium]